MRLRWVVVGLLLTALLVPALTLTAARLLDLTGGDWVRLVAFTPYATVLYLAALVLAVLAWVKGRGFWGGLARLLTVVALMGVVVHGYWSSPPFLGSPAAEATSQQATVLTSNLRAGNADVGQVLELASRSDAEVVVLQEVTPQALASLRRLGIERAYPHQAGGPDDGTLGTMVFAKGRISDVRRIPTRFASYSMDVRMPGLAGEPGSDAAADRGGLLVRLVAAHPSPPVGDVSDWWAEQRAVREAARSLDRPSMVVGDLNATMDHRPLRELVGRGYADAATEATSWWQPTWPSDGQLAPFGLPLPPLVAIDHVLVGGGLDAVGTDTTRINGTDHRALTATLAR